MRKRIILDDFIRRFRRDALYKCCRCHVTLGMKLYFDKRLGFKVCPVCFLRLPTQLQRRYELLEFITRQQPAVKSNSEPSSVPAKELPVLLKDAVEFLGKHPTVDVLVLFINNERYVIRQKGD